MKLNQSAIRDSSESTPASALHRTPIKTVRAVLFLPGDRSYLFSVEHTLPAVESAISHVRHHVLPDVDFHVLYKNSGCNGRDAPVVLFNLIRTNSVDLVLGPVCDYALAPVGRYAPFWNLPVLTSGGFAHDFGRKAEEYSTLTRLGQNFEDLSEFFVGMLTWFVWNTLHLIYDAKGLSLIHI